MHPLLGRLAGLIVYLALWLALGLAASLGLAVRGGWPWSSAMVSAVPLCLAYGVVCLAAWYVCRAFPVLGAGTVGRVLLAHAAAAGLTSTVWVTLAQWWATLVGGVADWPRDATLLLFAGGVLLFLLSSALHYVFLALEAQEAARRQALESAVLAREAELRALRAQVNPHFLFNSLHSIGALAGSRPAAARDMAIALGEFLRHSVQLGGLRAVTLQEEIDLMARYLSIEQVRFGDRLQVRIDVEQAAGASRVPPLLLQPLVENAIKHGVAGLLEAGEVSIAARHDGRRCHVAVVNAFDPEAQPRVGTGTGVRNVRDRLATYYGSTATFEARADGDRFTVTMTYPCDEAASRPEETGP
ncbi:histidine kinase [Luteitalea sp.]|uniref:sensor histidine kinase n=1 Tax=Luteitalea sp. TaxID=2004800 RepID=UPI0025C5FAC1|nr:histidine kinase [Luteitalea sp.]